MSTANLIKTSVIAVTVLCCACVGFATAQQLGRSLTDNEIKQLNRHVFANGDGLPKGTGNAVQGAVLFEAHCASCHGSQGEGGAAVELVGDRALLATEYPDKGIAVYWPWAPTLFEYIRRSMPPNKPYSLSVDETYSVVARVLELNGLITGGQNLDAAVLSAIHMPNRDGFISDSK